MVNVTDRKNSGEPEFTDVQAEELINDYLIRHNFTTTRFNTKKLGGLKSPDFKVYLNKELYFYCEVKNPMLLVNDITKMFHWTTSISKIRRFIHKAVQQLNDVDNHHNFPWIIIFTSSHFQLNWSNFSDSYLGYVARNGKMIRDLRHEKYVSNTNRDVNTVDAYIWCQVNSKNKIIYQLVPFINAGSRLKVKVEKIITKLKPSQSENISDINSQKYN